jgi:hypothetical protein
MSLEVVEQSAIYPFVEKTDLIPAIVLDGVVGEVCQYLKDDALVGQIYVALRSNSTLQTIEDKTAHAFASSTGFKRAVLAADPRPGYYSFMRHWVSAELKAHFPAQFHKLPSGFRVGQPL